MSTMKKLDRQNVEDILALTPLQEGMLFHYLNDSGGGEYFEQLSLRLSGRIDGALIKKAWQVVVTSNEMLRTVFRWEKIDKPTQIVLKKHDLDFREYDFSRFGPERRGSLVEEVKKEDKKDPFDLRDVPFRIRLCKLGEDRCDMLISNHHILYDGWSNGIILKEFTEAYNTLLNGGLPVPIQKNRFKSFVKFTQVRDKESQKAFWQEYLKEYETKTQLPMDMKNRDEATRVDKHTHTFDADRTAHIEEAARTLGVTAATLLYSVWGILLKRYNDMEVVVFGTTVSGRDPSIKGIENMVGLFINTLPLRIKTSVGEPISQLLRNVEKGLRERGRHENTPLVDIKAYSPLQDKYELFDSLVIIENYPLDKVLNAGGGPFKVDSFSMEELTNYELTVTISMFESITVEFVYNRGIYCPETISRLAGHFIRIINAALETPELKIADIRMLTEKERFQLLTAFNDNRVEYPSESTIRELVEAQVLRTPDSIAVLCDDWALSYRQLDGMANHLARRLREKGVTPDSITGIMTERNQNWPVAILGVLKAGGAYLPLVHDYPEENILYLLDDSESRLLITQPHLESNVNFSGETLTIQYENPAPGMDRVEPLTPANTPDHLAYVIYTSGTTGKPKGVAVQHGNVNNFFTGMTAAVPFAPGKGIMAVTTTSFDIFLLETIYPLTRGMFTLLVKEEFQREPEMLSWLIFKYDIDILQMTPSRMQLLIGEISSMLSLKRLETILVGGEAFPKKLLVELSRRTGARIINVYGPTETTVWSAVKELTGLKKIDIGSPLANQQIYILDRRNHPKPIGVPGELCIAGDGVARGYLRRPDLTAEKFVDNPFVPGTRMYRTGDLARWMADGNIEFIGRVDYQVKIRGYRVELGEIETQLLTHGDIKEAVVIDVEDEHNQKFLGAYVVARKEVDSKEIREYLASRLPEYMVPSFVVQMENFPLTTSGKVNRKELPEPEQAVKLGEYEPPANELEEKLADIWQELFGLDEVGVYDNFFDLGGHSLKAVSLSSRISRELDVSIPVSEIFKTSDIRGLAKSIRRAEASIYLSIAPAGEGDTFPVSAAQKRMLALHQMEPENTGYNMTGVMAVEGKLDWERFEKAFRRLVDRHESFRTSFDVQGGEAVQKIHKSVDFHLQYGEIGEDTPVEELIRAFVKPFVLSYPPLLRVMPVRTGPEKHWLLVDMHHIISDGHSLGIIVRDFAEFYEGRAPLELKVQYKGYTRWQKELSRKGEISQQENFWKEQFAGEVPVLELVTDFPRPNFQGSEGDAVYFNLDPIQTEGIEEMAGANRATLFIVLLSVYNLLLSRYTGQEDIVVGSVISGRPHTDLEDIVGMFVNTLALRNRPLAEKPFETFLEEVKTLAFQAYENQDYQFEELVSVLDLKRDLSRNPLFDTMFTLELTEVREVTVANLVMRPHEFEKKTAKFDLSLEASDLGDTVGLRMEYATHLFKEETIRRMGAHYVNIVNEILRAPEVKIGLIDFLSGREHRQLVMEFNDTKLEYPAERLVHQWFEEQVEKHPEAAAVVEEPAGGGEARTVSYRELNSRANRLAHRLRIEGAGPDSIIAVIIERSADMFASLLGILKSGAAYMPLDPEHPESRIQFMLEDTSANLLVGQPHLLKEVRFDGVLLDTGGDLFGEGDDSNPEPVNGPGDLCYVIYTSGTTGKPKGVLSEHRNFTAYIYAFFNEFQLESADTLLLLGTYTFDAFVEEMYPILLRGGQLVVKAGEKIRDMQEMRRMLLDYHVSVISCTPLLINEINKLDCELPDLRLVISGGDVLKPGYITRLKEKTAVYNTYGPTEGTVCVTYHRCGGEDIQTIPIGRPIANYSVYLLDRGGQLVPVGVPGELCIGGPGVARGYLNAEKLTKQKFAADPRRPGYRMYKTGDLARWFPDGRIDFLGRIDQQVKIRGFRIELGEIESRLLKFPAITDALVMVKEDPQSGKSICAYVVSDRKPALEAVKEYLLEELPPYMLPSYIIPLTEFPVTPTGKVDRRALPEPEGLIIRDIPYEAPGDELEERLAGVWSEVLGIEKISVHDDFFTSGGDSIKAIQVSARLQKYRLKMDIKNLFQYPTIRKLRPYVEIGRSQAEQGLVTGDIPLTPIQHSFFGALPPNPNHWNQSVMLFREQGFDQGHVKLVLSQLVRHHDALRMRFQVKGDTVSQLNPGLEGRFFHLTLHDFSGEEDPEARIGEAAARVQESLDIKEGPLAAAGLFKTADGDHLLLVIHHLVVDGVSWRFLVEDFQTGYRGAMADETITFPEKSDSYKEWAVQLGHNAESRQLLRELPIWTRLERTALVPLPRDHQPGSDRVGDSRVLEMRLSAEDTTALLTRAPKAYRTEINDLLLTALGLTLKEWTRQDKVGIFLEGHGREPIIEDIDISRTAGWFTSVYPVVLDMGVPGAAGGTGTLVKHVKETLRRIPNKGVGYGILRYLAPPEVKKYRRPKASLDIGVRFNYLGQVGQDEKDALFTMSHLSGGDNIDPGTPRDIDIDINGMIRDGQLELQFSYNPGAYEESTMQGVVDGFKKNLETVIRHCAEQPGSESTPSDLGSTWLSLEELDILKQETSALPDTPEGAQLRKVYPLTPMQQGMLFHTLASPESGVYFEQTVFTVNGRLDLDAFQRSFASLVERYDILRTVFNYQKASRPVQLVMEKRDVKLPFEDISHLPEEEKTAYIEDFTYKDRDSGFDLARDLLMRISILKAAEEEYRVVWSFHHIIMDGWCLAILLDEFFTIYGALKKGETPRLGPVYPYGNYIQWLENRDPEDAARYWKEYLRGMEVETRLSHLAKSAKGGSYEARAIDFFLDAETTAAMTALANRENVTLNTLFQTAWGLLLQRYLNCGDTVFGGVVSGRSARIEGIEKMVGLFINTLPIRVDARKPLSVRQLLKQVQKDAVAAVKFDYYPLADIQAQSSLKQELLDHIIIFENYPMDKEIEQIGNTGDFQLQLTGAESFEQTNYDFNIIVIPGKELKVTFHYNSTLYKEHHYIRAMARHFKGMVARCLEDPDIAVESIDFLSHEEKSLLLEEWNATGRDYPSEKTLHQLFREQVERTPGNIAVSGPAGTAFTETGYTRPPSNRPPGIVFLTYNQLREKADRAALVLQEQGVGPDCIVGVMINRTVELPAVLLGILTAGAAYLPIDPAYPEGRVQYMLNDSGADLLVTTASLAEKLSLRKTLILLDHMPIEPLEESPPLVGRSTDLAYVIYTSGTTGKPKGVMVEHRGVANYSLWRIDNHGITPHDVTLQLFSFSFDGFGSNFYTCLLSGGKLVIVGDAGWRDFRYVRGVIVRESVTGMAVVPSMFHGILEGASQEDTLSLRFVTLAGEKSDPRLIRMCRSLNPGITIINEYGPTENSIGSTFYMDMDEDATAIIGGPLANNRVYILDRLRRLQPAGVPGELCVSGHGLARGYHGREGLTAEKFIPNPFTPEPRGTEGSLPSRLYRTGDLARWRGDGTVEFFGRIDYQVKIRGFRVELGEIEALLNEHPDVGEAVVTDRNDAGGNTYLCAYIVSQTPVTAQPLQKYLAGHLPDYMVPAYYVQLEKLPLSPTGKINRGDLPEPSGWIEGGEDYVPPRDEIEKKLVTVWQELLNRDNVGIRDDFFQLGGHSLKATQLIGRVHKEFNVEYPLNELFSAATIGAMGGYIRGAEVSIYAEIEPAPHSEFYPLSAAQKRLFTLSRFEGDAAGAAYNIPAVMTVTGPLNLERFKQLIRTLVKRHDALRTSFHLIGGEPVQTVHPMDELEVELEYVDTRTQRGSTTAYPSFTDRETDDIVKGFMRPFDLSRPPLFRAGVTKVGEERFILMLNMHHIISDGVSVGIIVRECLDLAQRRTLPELKLQYKDFALWQHRLFEEGTIDARAEYWKETLAGDILPPDFPTDFPRPAMQSFDGETIGFSIPAARARNLKAVAAHQKATLYMALLAVYSILMERYTGMDDILVGSPVAGRPHPGLRNIVGMFVNTLVMRNFPTRDKSFDIFLEELKQRTLRAYENQDYPFDQLVEQLDLKRDLSRNPLFDTMLVLQNIEIPTIELEHLRFNPYNFEQHTSTFDMTLTAAETAEGIDIEIEYCTRLFKRESMELLGQRFVRVVDEVVKNPEVFIGGIDLLSGKEKRRILEVFNRTGLDYPRQKTLHGLFEDQVERTPEAVALVGAAVTSFFDRTPGEDVSMNYSRLNHAAGAVARALLEKGIEPEQPVALVTHRSVEMMIAMLGVLKAGAAYVPMAIDAPTERLRFMTEDTETPLVLSTRALLETLEKTGLEKEILYIDDIPSETEYSNREDVDASHLAYVIYTSGTTGLPKGVLIEHRQVTAYVHAFLKEFPLEKKDVVLAQAAYTFDASVEELYPVLTRGGQLVVARPEQVRDAKLLAAAVDRYRATLISCSPLLLNELNKLPRLESLRFIISGGDVLRPEHISHLSRQAAVYNTYGPTETTVCATYYRCRPGEEGIIPIGRPIANTHVYIMNDKQNLLPAGIAGEICIAGDGVSRGYLKRPELTSEKFVSPGLRDRGHETAEKKDPEELMVDFLAEGFVPNGGPQLLSPIYKSGDLGRWLPDGNILFMGRIDTQVKIRGYRIELGEIESSLLSQPDITEAAVIDRTGEDDEKYLCAYFVSPVEYTVTRLREVLAQRLPEYMIPQYFVPLEKLPQTSSGKLDRRALPEPVERLAAGAEYTAPRDDVEETLVRIWEEVLGMRGITKIGIHDNFFEIGGHSLKAVQVVNAAAKELQCDLALGQLFRHPTVAGLAAVIEENVTGGYMQIEELPQQDHYELSYAQKRLWILYRMEPQSSAYNMPDHMILHEAVDETVPAKVIDTLAQRHESLRTRFHEIDGEPVQVVEPQSKVKLLTEDISALSPAEQEERLQRFYREIFEQPFNLETGPLFRVKLVKCSQEKYDFIYAMHHIVSDGWSMEILKREFFQLYSAFRGGEPSPLEPLRVQYKDFASWQNRLLADSGQVQAAQLFWQEQLARELPILNLPREPQYAQTGGMEPTGAAYRTVVPAGVKEVMKTMARERNASLFMVILAGFNLFMSHLTGQEDILLGMAGAGREHDDLKSIAGFFINTLLLKTTADPAHTFSQLLEGGRETTLKVLEYQNYPLELMVDRLKIKYPKISVFVNMLNLGETEQGELENLEPYHEEQSQETKFDMTCYFTEYANGIEVVCNYQSRLFKPATIEYIMGEFVKTLAAVAENPERTLKEYGKAPSAAGTGKRRKIKRRK